MHVGLRWFVLAIAGCVSPCLAGAPEPAQVTLVADGKSDWPIVCSAQEPPAAQWAAEELRAYTRRMSRCELRRTQATAAGPALVLGLRANLAAEDRELLPPPASGYDGYAIAVRTPHADRPARVVIAGENGRGVLYGVYDLLERWGCRWFYPTQDPNDPEVVPDRATLALESGAWAVGSPFWLRVANGSAWYFDRDDSAAEKELDWAMKNRYNAIGWQSESKTPLLSQYQRMQKDGLLAGLARREMLLHGPGHSFDHFLKAADYLGQHPEWFGMREGKRVPQTVFGAQFCWSNAQARAQFIENLAGFVRQCPQIAILYIAPFDGGKCCACPDCQRTGASNLLMLLLGEVIERLRATAPAVRVETVGGYQDLTTPPAPGQIHAQQRILWAHWGRYFGTPYDDPRYGGRANLEQWHQAARGGLTVCQYYADNFCAPWIMPPCVRSIQGDRSYLMAHAIDSVYVLMWPPGCWWNHSLNGHLAGRCFFDASLDPWAALGDYARHYFGAAAGAHLAAYYEQWAREIELAYRVRGGTRDVDRAMLAAQRRDWLEPAVSVAQASPVYTYRLGKVEKLHALAERLADEHRRHGEIVALRKDGLFDEAKQRLDQSRSATAETVKMLYRLADLHQGLVDRNDVSAFIAAAVKAWIDQEAKAIDARSRK